jgi:hypothetical protein
VNGVTSREYTQQAVIALGHEDGTDAAVTHISASLSYRRARGKRDRILVPDHVRHVSHHNALCLSNEVYRLNLEVYPACLDHRVNFLFSNAPSSADCLIVSSDFGSASTV